MDTRPSFVLDGESVILRPDGTSDFDLLHSRRCDCEVHLLGFDLLELDGNGTAPRAAQAARARLLRRSYAGIQVVEHEEPVGGAPEQLARQFHDDFAKYGRLVKELNIRIG